MKDTKVFSTAALILAAGAIAIAGFIWFKISRIDGGIESQVLKLKREVETNTIQAKANINFLQNQLSEQNRILSDAENKLSRVLSTGQNTQVRRILAQVAYLLQLANLHLEVGHDSTTSLKLVRMAQHLLKPLNDANLFSLKRAIQHDVALLKAAPQYDISHVVLQIDKVKQSVDALTIVPTKATPHIKSKPADAVKNDRPWYKKTLSLFAGLKDLVTVRRIHPTTAPLITPQQEVYLKQHIQIELAQAQWAALNHDTKIYQQSLKNVRDWLQKYVHDHTDTKTIVHQLDLLLKINVRPNLPNLSRTLDIVQQDITDRFSTNDFAPVTQRPVKKIKKKEKPKIRSAPANPGVAI